LAGNRARPLVTAQTTEGKYAAFVRELAETRTACGGPAWVLSSNLKLSLKMAEGE